MIDICLSVGSLHMLKCTLLCSVCVVLFVFFLPYINKCWSLRGPCAKGQGDLVGKTFQKCLSMTDD